VKSPSRDGNSVIEARPTVRETIVELDGACRRDLRSNSPRNRRCFSAARVGTSLGSRA